MTPWVGAALAGVLAVTGRLLGWLTRGGAVAAGVIGAAVFIGAGLRGAALLALFFVTGSVLTKLARGRARADRQELGRSARQVIANGGWAAVGAALIAGDGPAGWTVLAGGLSAAQADTWATEIGVRAPNPPHLLTTGQTVPPGTSGGVTLLGSAAGIAGAAIMAGAGWLVGLDSGIAVAALIGGIVGMTVDSLLGATLQGMHYCDACAAATERAVHGCGRRARLVRGRSWLDNDLVNLAGSGTGAACAFLVWIL